MKRQQQGFVLIVTLLLLIVTMTLLTGYVIFTMMEARNTRSTANMSSGFYAAEAGLNIEVEEIRTIFDDYRRPDLTEGNCEDQDPVTFSDRVVSATVCADQIVDDASEATRISDPDNPFNGLLSFDSVYNINSVATNSDGEVETQLDMQLRVQEIPVFQFAAFYDGNFEVFPGPDMEITGRVHANGVVGLFKSGGGGKLSLMENVTSASICKPPLPEQGRCAEGERTMKMYHRQISNWNRSGAGTSQIKMPDGSFEKFGSGGPSEWTAEELEDTFQGRAQIINELQVPQASSFARQTAANTNADDDEDAFLYWKRADLRLIAHQPDDSNDTDAVVDVFDEAGRTAPSVTYWKGFDAREGQGWWGLDGWWDDTTRDDPGEPETYRTLTECLLSGFEDSEEFDLEEHLFTDAYFDDDGNPVDVDGDPVTNIENSRLYTLISDARAPEDCFPLIGSYEPTVEMPKVEVHTESGVDNTATRKLYQAMLDMPGVITVNVPRNHIEAGVGRPDSNDWRSAPNETLNMVVRDSRNINHSGFNMVADRDETSGGHYMWPQAYNPVNNTRDDVEFTYFPLGPDDANLDVYAFDEGDNVAAPLPCSVYDNRPLGRVGSPIGGVGIRAHEEDLVFRGQTRNSQRYAQHFVNDLMALPRNTAIMRFRLRSNEPINDDDIANNNDDDWVIDVLFLDNDDNDAFIPTGSNDTFDYTGGNPNQNSDEGRELEAMREYYAWSYPVTIGMLMDYMYDNNSYEWDIDHDEDDKIGIEHFLANNNDTPKDVDHNISIDVDDLGFFFPFYVTESGNGNNITTEPMVYNPDEDNPDIVENETFQIALLKAIAHDLENNEGNGFDLDDDANQDDFDFDEEDDRLQSRWHLSNTFDPHAANNIHNNDRRWYDDKDGRDKDFRNFVKALLGVSEDDGDRWMKFDNGGNDEEFDDNLHHHGLVVRPGLLQNLQSSWYTFGYDPEDLEDICAAVPTRGELYSYREERELFVLNINVGELMQTDDSDLIKLSEDNESESGIVLYASFEGERIDVERPADNDFEGNNYAVRLHNGADFSLGNGANATDNNSVRGFTFVTDQAAMVQGDFNCIRDGDGCRGDDDASGDDRRRIGAAVLADSPNILSVNWMDMYSRGRLKRNRRDSGDRHVHRWYRDADETRQNVALLGGSDEAGYMRNNDDIEGGGLHNYPRFWEDWNAAYRYKGSLVSFNLPQKWSGRFATQKRNGDNDAAYFGERNRGCCTIVYSPPRRLWEYDKNFESPRNLPPLTPRVVYLNQESFSRDFTQD